MWISYLEFLTIAQGQTKAGFTKHIDTMFSKIKDYGLNTVFVQVRPFGDALYDSKLFPYSYVLTGTEGVNPGYDPLDIMVDKAKEYGLRIEAWINPYRIRASASSKPLASNNIALKHINSQTGAVIQYNGGIFYNPASTTARELIVAGVVEILDNYDVDGIHFDDYFYPTTDAAFDSSFYQQYQNAGGRLSLADWRRDNVNKLVREVYEAIKQVNSKVIFGISPQARVDVNYNAQYADVEKWLSSSGYIDYICPQIYFGFDHEIVPYTQLLNSWNSMAKQGSVDLYIGLAVYKCGVVDNGAKAGKNEWVYCDTMLADMLEEARSKSTYKGVVLYRYDSLFQPEAGVAQHMKNERAALQKVL